MDLADRIIFEDAEALLLDKPAGLPVDPPRDGGPSIAGLAGELRFGFQREPVPAHRIDRDTSGCLLLARNPKALKRFQASFADRTAEKTYLAIVAGVPQGEIGQINLSLVKSSTKAAGWRMIPARKGLEAVTDWALLATVGELSLLQLVPHSGRTHQLRVHCASGLGCPIVGDGVYGRAHSGGMMLHASLLTVPRGAKPPVIGHAPFPTRFVALGFGDPDV
jgi:tRNA pseudouridine32 synthase/23S rRNA pseudouridine746 synthase